MSLKHIKTDNTNHFKINKNFQIVRSLSGNEDLDRDSSSPEDQERILGNLAKETDIQDKKDIIKWTKQIVTCWLFAVLVIVVLNNFLKLYLSDNVIIVLLSTTSVNVIGLAFVTIKGLVK